MTIRHLALALLTLTACAVDPVGSTTEDAEDALTCGSFCDPFDYTEPQLLDITLHVGRSWFPDAVQYGQGSCADVGPDGHPEWDCIVSLITTANPCGTVAIECVRGHCSWTALDGCH